MTIGARSPSGSTRGRRRPRASERGGALLKVLALIIGLAGAAAAGFAGARWLGDGSGQGAVEEPAPGEDERWYTCGMHPDVIQKGPGECPICHMRLTPLEAEGDDGEGAERGGAGGTAAKGPKEREILYWRAPMDPSYTSPRPGKSPMGMDLVPVYADAGAGEAAGRTIRIDPVTVQNMGIRTAGLERAPLVKTIRTVGRVEYDEKRVHFVDTKFSGWIEELHVAETGRHVAKGEPLFEVYSPELYAAQEEYLAAVRNLPLLERSTLPSAREDARQLVEAAATKLRYLDVSEKQIEDLAQSGEVHKTMTISAPAEGIATDKMALDGMYVKPGMRLYTIADLSRVWVLVDVYEYQLPWVRIGQSAEMTLPYLPGRPLVGRVVYIYPYLDARTRVVKVRLEFPNPDLALKPGMFANVTLRSELDREALLIPRMAYIDSGIRKVAFVMRGEGKFDPREIRTGVEGEDGMVEVLSGLEEGEVVVTSGQFLLDAESKLKEAIRKMMDLEATKGRGGDDGSREGAGPPSPMAGKEGHEAHGIHVAASMAAPAGLPAGARFACPMEEHPTADDPADRGPYFAAGPGRCPRCGMELEPLEDLPWAQALGPAERAGPGATADGGGDAVLGGATGLIAAASTAYTCPDHPRVVAGEPAACPRCGRSLEPFEARYTCPDPDHAAVSEAKAGTCPRCGQALALYRGRWLGEAMAAAGETGGPPAAQEPAGSSADAAGAPHRAALVCPMHSHVEVQPGRGEVDAPPPTCPICGMRLVRRADLTTPALASERVRVQMDYALEHYLALQRRLASDRTDDVALHALGLAAAAEALAREARAADEDSAAGRSQPGAAAVADIAARLRAAALKVRGQSLEDDRVPFVEIGEAMASLLAIVQPDAARWPQLYVLRCPVSKGRWIQAQKAEVENPYYGFQNLRCGEVVETVGARQR